MYGLFGEMYETDPYRLWQNVQILMLDQMVRTRDCKD